MFQAVQEKGTSYRAYEDLVSLGSPAKVRRMPKALQIIRITEGAHNWWIYLHIMIIIALYGQDWFWCSFPFRRTVKKELLRSFLWKRLWPLYENFRKLSFSNWTRASMSPTGPYSLGELVMLCFRTIITMLNIFLLGSSCLVSRGLAQNLKSMILH